MRWGARLQQRLVNTAAERATHVGPDRHSGKGVTDRAPMGCFDAGASLSVSIAGSSREEDGLGEFHHDALEPENTSAMAAGVTQKAVGGF